MDEELLEAAGILEYEKVHIVDVNNGSRFETYTICGKRGSGMICLNGAAARCVSTGDKIIIMAYAGYEPEEARTHKPAVVFVDEENKISRVTNYEKHGLLKDMAREKKILDGATFTLDAENPKTSDSAWFVVEADDIDSLEKIYLHYRFSNMPTA